MMKIFQKTLYLATSRNYNTNNLHRLKLSLPLLRLIAYSAKAWKDYQHLQMFLCIFPYADFSHIYHVTLFNFLNQKQSQLTLVYFVYVSILHHI